MWIRAGLILLAICLVAANLPEARIDSQITPPLELSQFVDAHWDVERVIRYDGKHRVQEKAEYPRWVFIGEPNLWKGPVIFLTGGERKTGRLVSFRCDLKCIPPTIDIIRLDELDELGLKKHTQRGIFLLEEDRLRICLAEEDNPVRPRYVDAPSSGQKLLILRRLK